MPILHAKMVGPENEGAEVKTNLKGDQLSMAVVTMKQLLESGVHFGHQTRRWNPKMKKYIFTDRNGIYIIDLQKTIRMLDQTYRIVRDMVAEGGKILFVGTKKQAQESIRVEAERCGMFYVNQRWLGGMLTNYKTISTRINRLNELEQMEEDGHFELLTKKEVIFLQREKEKLLKYLGGIRDMDGLPDAVYIVDSRKERIAVAEARRLGIPIIAIVDTNCDPDEIDHIIPGNDDAIRAIKLISSIIANAVLEGRQIWESLHEEVEEGDDPDEEKPVFFDEQLEDMMSKEEEAAEEESVPEEVESGETAARSADAGDATLTEEGAPVKPGENEVPEKDENLPLEEKSQDGAAAATVKDDAPEEVPKDETVAGALPEEDKAENQKTGDDMAEEEK